MRCQIIEVLVGLVTFFYVGSKLQTMIYIFLNPGQIVIAFI